MQLKKYLRSQVGVVLLQFLGVVILFTITRLLFFIFNAQSFPNANAVHFVQGIRFDISILLYINLLYIIFKLIPCTFTTSRAANVICNIYFITLNSIAIALNFIDTCYYPFAMRRMTGDIFQFMEETNNMGELIPIFAKEYYYMFLIFAAFVVLLYLLCKWSEKVEISPSINGVKAWLKAICTRIVILFLILTGMRGGWQYRPINNTTAVATGGVENAALVLNTPFSLLTTLHVQGLTTQHYFADDADCEKYFSTNKQQFTNQYFKSTKTQNVVLIILEGISSEYSELLADEPKENAGYTPFLDSLAKQSIVFKGYANGQQSIEALSSILGGIPSLMNTPFSQSAYTTNTIHYAIPHLKKMGMTTAFFHGGKNGTMGFDRYCQSIGIEQYYGMDEYPNAIRDFDGNWGIPDQPYLQYVADELNQYNHPFFATIFTLSSHHPFVVPQEYDKKVKQGNFPMQHTVAYTDRALQDFFQKISKEDWYQNTLFVITADHTNFSGAENVDYQKHRYSIPIILYHPQADTAFLSEQIMQQTDIMPTIFSFCGWSNNFSSFGNNALDPAQPHFAINYLSNSYQLYIDNYLIEYDGKEIRHIWDLTKFGSEREVAVAECPKIEKYKRLLQSIIQQYNNKLIYNKL